MEVRKDQITSYMLVTGKHCKKKKQKKLHNYFIKQRATKDPQFWQLKVVKDCVSKGKRGCDDSISTGHIKIRVACRASVAEASVAEASEAAARPRSALGKPTEQPGCKCRGWGRPSRTPSLSRTLTSFHPTASQSCDYHSWEENGAKSLISLYMGGFSVSFESTEMNSCRF